VTVDERAAMGRALELARDGWGRVHPNPLVGAVVLRDGELVGEGAHLEFGGPHAEVTALAEAGEAARGATCVVTLEPCAHHGKTPPCVEALANAGVSRVVYAADDPAEGAGGAERLRSLGVAVQGGLLGEEARSLNAPFFARGRGRPWVAVKVATSLDGYLADPTGRSQWISGPEARAYVHWLRAGFDAIAVGRGTVAADDPRLTVRGTVEPRIPPRRVVLSRSGNVPEAATVVRTAGEIPTTVVCDPARADATRARLDTPGLDVLAADGLLGALRGLGDRGVGSMLVEGGAELANALLDADLVDRVYWITAPRWLGAGTAAFRRPAGSLDTPAGWRFVERRALGDDTLLVIERGECSPES
jgi:diaminohydroxyphosphoribosylaminopyrimidine deaminase/5-amino-6-(5-phosphoribosylamino)uracil reductase